MKFSRKLPLQFRIMLLAGAIPPAAAVALDGGGRDYDHDVVQNSFELFARRPHVFRYDTFEDEAFWGDTLKLHRAIPGEAGGGVGPGVSPAVALGVGLKLDVEALPRSLQRDLRAGRVNLADPATTVALLKLNSVVGVTGVFDGKGRMQSRCIRCALCHSTVDDSFAPGIGRRFDDWPNRDRNVGAIIALAPDLTPLTASEIPVSGSEARGAVVSAETTMAGRRGALNCSGGAARFGRPPG